jgi:hypothetical protein
LILAGKFERGGHSRPGLPDGVFSNQKMPILVHFGGP